MTKREKEREIKSMVPQSFSLWDERKKKKRER
jgi:hypothetical protein